uniref:Glycolipid transfer protein domain-containing protein n=1 Tax=Parascaris univalens TaxID=6257 RepID=A0A915ACF3_PARUN
MSVVESKDLHSFDIDIVSDHFERAIIGECDVDLPLYIAAYKELNKLFALLGTVFAFVKSDVEAKEAKLANLYASNREHYATVCSMVSWECRDGVPEEQGSRTLLRLHRALQFVNDFLASLKDSSDDVQVSWLCRRSYERTLSQYHGWLTRKGVAIASYTLSSRRALVQTIIGANGPSPSEERVNTAILRMLNASTRSSTASFFSPVMS